MSKDIKENDDDISQTVKNWSYDGSEDEWNTSTFDHRMQRYMWKKLRIFSENIWLGTIPDFYSTRTPGVLV